MSIYNPRLYAIDVKETKRYAGLSGDKNFPEHILAESCVQARLLSHPKASWNIYPYDCVSHNIISPEPFLLTSQDLISILAGAAEVAVIAVTIGQKLEEEVSNLFTKGAYTNAILLDAAGTTAVEQACDQLTAFLAQQVSSSGYILGSRFSPGYGDFDISCQPEVLYLADAGLIGINVTAAMMLVPRKSVTAIIGIYPYQQTVPIPHQSLHKPDCSNCRQPQCQSRKDTK